MPYTDKIQYDRTGSASGTPSTSPPIPTYNALSKVQLTWGTNTVGSTADDKITLGSKFRVTGLSDYFALFVPQHDVGPNECVMNTFLSKATNENINMEVADVFPTGSRTFPASQLMGEMLHLKRMNKTPITIS